VSKRLFAASHRGRRASGFALALLAVVIAAGAFALLRDRPVRIDPGDAQQVALGKQLYATACAGCHGASLEGQPNWQRRLPNGRLPAPPHDASGHTWHHPDELLFRITKLGVARAANLKDYASAMPAYEGVLSDAEIVAVLSWIKAQWPPDIRAKHDQLNRVPSR